MRETDLIGDLLKRDYEDTEAYLFARRVNKYKYRVPPTMEEKAEKLARQKEKRGRLREERARMSSSEDFNKEVREFKNYLKRKGILCKDLAYVVGVTPFTISRWFYDPITFAKHRDDLKRAAELIHESRYGEEE